MIISEPRILVLAEALFPTAVMTRYGEGPHSYQSDWHYMIAAGNRCRIFHDAAAPPDWQFTCEVMDGAHAGVRFDAGEAAFLKAESTAAPISTVSASPLENPFRSFWMGGFECSDKLNAFGNRVDLLAATDHLELIDLDYTNLARLNIATVREGIRWSRVEPHPGVYDWSDLHLMQQAARRHGIQQVWDLCHFGFPDDLTPLHPMFARRFAALCREFVRAFRKEDPDGTLIVTPINEVGFLSWLGGDVRGTSPYCLGQGWEVKYALMRAYIEGVAALREEDPFIRIMTTEPLVNITTEADSYPFERNAARDRHHHQFQATDILCGKMCPELGGSPGLLDIVGVNYYYNNQWLDVSHRMLCWKDEIPHSGWKPLRDLLQEVHARYGRPIVISETSHPHEDRPLWMRSVAAQCRAAIKGGIPLWGVCWYPIIDRPDWDHGDVWHRSGIWDRGTTDGPGSRVLHEPTASEFLAAQKDLLPKTEV